MAEDIEDTPIGASEPDPADKAPQGIWIRGLWMIVLAILFGVGETILAVCAVIQWLWMLFTKQRNGLLADFGKDLGKWMQDVAAFQTASTDEKPFPWKKWGA